MEIVYFFKDYQVPMYQWQHVHIFSELRTHGCNITVISPLDYKSNDDSNKALLTHIKNNKVDLFMTPHNEECLKIDTLISIKNMGIPTLLICFDNLIVPFIHERIAPYFDLVWLTSKETKPLFDKTGANTLFLPYAANPNLPRCEESINGVGFVGTPYGSRANMINCLTKNKISVFCHCLSNEQNEDNDTIKPVSSISKTQVAMELMKFHQGRIVLEGAIINHLKKAASLIENNYLKKVPVVAPSELYMVYPKYALALASTAARNTGVLRHPLNIVNLRSFEIPMSGGLQICQYSEEMAEYFEEDKEIIFYKTNEELVDKAKFYLSPKQEVKRRQMRIAARKAAKLKHTWFCRFSVVFDCFGIRY